MAEMADEEQELDDFTEVTVLEVGSTVPYTVPSFPVFKTELVEVNLPAIAHLPFNYDCCFTIFGSNIFMLK